MKDWFESLQARERLFVSTGAVFVVLALVYALAWAPLDRKHALLRSDVESWQQSLAELRPLRAAATGAGQPGSTAAVRSLQSPLIIVDQTLRRRGLDRYRRSSQPTTSNGIRVVLEDIAFDELVLWLGDLSELYAMHVQVASFSAGAQALPGRIDATLTLERTP